MNTLNTSFRLLLISILFIISCQDKPNTTKINLIGDLEKISLIDEAKIKSISAKSLENNIKVSKFNLIKLEEKKLDSINIELIYFEYRNYLRCINSMRSLVEKIKNLKHDLIVNKNQLKNIKEDYLNSNNNRDDLDIYLRLEKDCVNKVSIETEKIFNLNRKLNEEFDSLNKEIELIING